MYCIEWNDSGDGTPYGAATEEECILACLRSDAIGSALDLVVADAEDAIRALMRIRQELTRERNRRGDVTPCYARADDEMPAL